MRIGIFFGGQSREREVSFAGGRTVYDNLDKNWFEAVPVFVDGKGNFILLNWELIYKGSIRDFYPPFDHTSKKFQIYIESVENYSDELIHEIGKPIFPHEFKKYFDFAFLALHGMYGEDGCIQGLLEWYNIPYSGSGILPSAIGIDKLAQKNIFAAAGILTPLSVHINKIEWDRGKAERKKIYEKISHTIGSSVVIKAPHQGSSVGVQIIKDSNFESFEKKVNQAFFRQKIEKEDWHDQSEEGHVKWIDQLGDIRHGIGFPLKAQFVTLQSINNKERLFINPDTLLMALSAFFNEETSESVLLESIGSEPDLLAEAYIEGAEFSCIVIQDENGQAIALPPTEIIKKTTYFDYRAKYLPGFSRKVTPINLPDVEIKKIQSKCEELFNLLQCQVYARIDGFITPKGEVYLNDPNTTSGMLPSSFFFHQAAEIGWNPSQFLTYIIYTSLQTRMKIQKSNEPLDGKYHDFLKKIDSPVSRKKEKIKVAVILGGYSAERHISVESGRNIYEKLASSEKYDPIPVFLTGKDEHFEMYILPIHILLKDNADDIRDKLKIQSVHSVIKDLRQKTKNLSQKFADKASYFPEKINFEELSALADVAFIALHGRPGEDGSLQKELEKWNIPYNGSGVESSQITINKYETNEILSRNGILTAQHCMVYKEDWQENKEVQIKIIEKKFAYPLIAKPVDDGCSAAVKKIKSSEELTAYANLLFRAYSEMDSSLLTSLQLSEGEEIPMKDSFLIEELIEAKGAEHFIEITGGLLQQYHTDGTRFYEVFEPSEALASGDVLSLEEKFLAGEGQNITPARFSSHAEWNKTLSQKVRAELEKVAELLDIRGYARIDAFVRVFNNSDVEVVIIEVNSLPGMTPATCIFHQAAINNYKPYQFIDAILDFAMRAKKEPLKMIGK